MAASPAQVPNNFNNPWSRQAAEQAVAYQAPVYEYPAVTPASTTHNTQPAPAYYNQQHLAYPVAPAPYNGQPSYFNGHNTAQHAGGQQYNKRNSKRNIIAAATATLGVLATGGVLYLSSDKGSQIESADNTVATEVAQPTLDIYKQQYDGKDYAVLLDSIMPIIIEERDNAQTESLINTDNLEGDLKWAQTAINNVSKTVAVAFDQENTVLGRNLLYGAYAPGEGTLNNLLKLVGSGSDAQIPRFQVTSVSDTYAAGKIENGNNDIPITSDTTLLNAINMNTAEMWNIYVTEKQSQSGEFTVPVITALIKDGNQHYTSRVRDWNPTR